MTVLCTKCKRPEVQFMLVGFMCRHQDCQNFFTTPESDKASVDFFVERYTGNNPDNKPGQDANVDDLDPRKPTQ